MNKRYSSDFRSRVAVVVKSGASEQTVASRLKISLADVQKWAGEYAIHRKKLTSSQMEIELAELKTEVQRGLTADSLDYGSGSSGSSSSSASGSGCGNPLKSFREQLQSQSNWCWAAVTVSINLYYHPTSAYTQCLLANNTFGLTTCCTDGSTKACNNGVATMATPLGVTHNWVSTTTTKPALSAIASEIENCRPLAVGILWTGGGGHALSINGNDGTRIRVGDPYYGYSWQVYATFPSSYQGGATWMELSFTQP